MEKGQLTAKRTTLRRQPSSGSPGTPAPRATNTQPGRVPGSRSLSLSQHYKARGQHQFKFVLLACKTT